MNELTLTRPDDWHCHLRDHAFLTRTVPDVAKRFGRAIVMPNLSPPISRWEQARDYLHRIKAHIPINTPFEPLMTLYLTDDLTAADIHAAKKSNLIHAYKYYPAHATTHAEAGIIHLQRIYPLLEILAQLDIPLLLHAEVTDPDVSIFDREAVFIDRHFADLVKNFPSLRMVFEHVSTKVGVDFVKSASPQVAATITPHHLLLNCNQLLSGGIKPHHYCLPILKNERDQSALIDAATSGNPKFFLGTDSAPHPQSKKESGCGPAGIYSAHAGIELYAEVFSHHGALEQLAGFASQFGAAFYQLPPNTTTITLIQQSWELPTALDFGAEKLIPLFAGKSLQWQIKTA